MFLCKGRKVNIDNGIANAVIGGWQASSILTLQSGFPLTVNGQDTSNTGVSSTGRMRRVRNPTCRAAGAEQDPTRFFNTAAFVINNRGEFGNVGRNTLNSPGIIGWDFSMLKNFRLPDEKRSLQLRFEWFNFPNHPNWGNPDTNVSSGNFGRLTATNTCASSKWA